MKIAIVTDDGSVVSQHFGRAKFYAILTIEDGSITHREMREKVSHSHSANETHVHVTEIGQRHGFDPASQSLHGRMSESISDCEALICRGMGLGAYENIKERGIHPIITVIESIDEAALSYAAGSIVDHTEKLH